MKKRTRVLVLSHISELLGGAERSMLDVFDYWSKNYGIEPEFILREPVGTLAKELRTRGWKYYPLQYDFWSNGSHKTNPEIVVNSAYKNTKAILSIEKIIKRNKYDLIMTNSIVCPWAALAAYYQKVPHVWFVREYGDLDHGRIFEIGRRKTFEDIGSLSDLIVANSIALGRHIQKYVNSEKVTVLYNPFNLESMHKRASQKVVSPFKNSDSLKIITTNNIAFSKGQMEATEAVGILNKRGENVEICIMGTGTEEDIESIKKVAKKHGIEDRVHFTGSKKNTLPYILHADVGVMASRKEAFGRATFECLAVGRPVVGANTGATPEMVEEGVNGYLYRQGDANDLAAKLKNYIKNKRLTEEHGRAAHLKAEKMMKGEYNVDSLYKKVEKIAKTGADNRPQPIHFMHQWFDYVEMTKKPLSLKRMVWVRIKVRIKPAYIRAKKLASWVGIKW